MRFWSIAVFCLFFAAGLFYPGLGWLNSFSPGTIRDLPGNSLQDSPNDRTGEYLQGIETLLAKRREIDRAINKVFALQKKPFFTGSGNTSYRDALQKAIDACDKAQNDLSCTKMPSGVRPLCFLLRDNISYARNALNAYREDTYLPTPGPKKELGDQYLAIYNENGALLRSKTIESLESNGFKVETLQNGDIRYKRSGEPQ